MPPPLRWWSIYFNRRLETAAASSLVGEPGALGSLARVLVNSGLGNPEKVLTESLRREVAQFAMPTTTRTGLARLEFLGLEPYEHSMSFREPQRLVEQVQDMKLMMARRSHRLGVTLLPLNFAVARDALRNTLAQSRKATEGTPPPERDWQSLIGSIQSLGGDRDINFLVNGFTGSSYVRSVSMGKWDDEAPQVTKTSSDSKR